MFRSVLGFQLPRKNNTVPQDLYFLTRAIENSLLVMPTIVMELPSEDDQRYDSLTTPILEAKKQFERHIPQFNNAVRLFYDAVIKDVQEGDITETRGRELLEKVIELVASIKGEHDIKLMNKNLAEFSTFARNSTLSPSAQKASFFLEQAGKSYIESWSGLFALVAVAAAITSAIIFPGFVGLYVFAIAYTALSLIVAAQYAHETMPLVHRTEQAAIKIEDDLAPLAEDLNESPSVRLL